MNFHERPSIDTENRQSTGFDEAPERSVRGSEMASEDAVRKMTGESAVTTIVNLVVLAGWKLGYEGSEALDSDIFEWPFQYADARPILDWICSSLRPSNVLSLSELLSVRAISSGEKATGGEFLLVGQDRATGNMAVGPSERRMEDIKEGIHIVAAALEKSSKSNLEVQQQISQEIKKIDGLSFDSRVTIYRALTSDEKAGKAFLGIYEEWRQSWLEMEFGFEIFVPSFRIVLRKFVDRMIISLVMF